MIFSQPTYRRFADWFVGGWVTAILLIGVTVLGACSSGGSDGTAPVRPTIATRATVVESTEAWSFDKAPGKIIRTPSYRIFTTERDSAIVDRLPAFLEDALAHYRTALGPLPGPPVKLDTYVMDNREQWKRVTMHVLGAAGEPFLRIGRGGFATRGLAVLYDIGTFDTLAIAAHEGWHQYRQRAFRNRLPIWLEEGVASYMEGHKWRGAAPEFLPWANVERYDRLRAARAEGTLLSLEELIAANPQDSLGRADQSGVTYYAQVWALTHFLNEGVGGRYSASLRALLADAAAGRLNRNVRSVGGASRSAVIFKMYFNEELGQASVEYDDFIDRITVGGARSAIVAGVSPVRMSRGAR